MEEDSTKLATVSVSKGRFERGLRVIEQAKGRRPVTDPITVQLVQEQEQAKRFRLMVESIDKTIDASGMRKLAFDAQTKASILGLDKFQVASALKTIDAFKGTAVKYGLAALWDQQPSTASQMLKGFNDGIAPLLAKNAAAGIKVPAVQHLFVPDIGAQLTAVSDVVRHLELSGVAVPRPVWPGTPTRQVPVRQRRDVRAFLARTGPGGLEMLDAVYDSLDRPNGISNSANSAAELIKLMMITLVPPAQVRAYARSKRATAVTKRHVVEVVASTHLLDLTVLSTLSRDGELGGRFHDVKHDVWVIGKVAARQQLLGLIDELEDLLVFLAESLIR